MSFTSASYFNDKFNQIFQSLNEEQQASVSHMDGPVMVIAGPGTGKTQMLAARIGYVLLNTDTQPQNILCLTYTEAGAVAMRQRLAEFIGPVANKVKIQTFHGFCNEVINYNPGEFENTTSEPAGEIEKIEIIHEVISAYSKPNELIDPKDTFRITRSLFYFFDELKREAFDIDRLREAAATHIAFVQVSPDYEYKRNSGNFKKGDKKEKEIAREVSKMNKFTTALDLFEAYLAKFREKGLYDFNDMLLWVIDKFNNDPEFLLNYQERYTHILVDEYQDTSGAQNHILYQLLAGDPEGKPNVFVVGDDDQSIYRFQGASIDNIAGFAEIYKDDLFVQVLKQNYRSSQSILDTATRLIAYNSERLINHSDFAHLDKNLVARGVTAKLEVLPHVLSFENKLQEQAWIAERIIEKHNRGEDLSQVAVLYRKHAQGEELLKYLLNKKVPVSIHRSIDLLEEKIILNVLYVLEYVHSEVTKPFSGDDYLFTLLHAGWWQLDPLEISKTYYGYITGRKEKNIRSFREYLSGISDHGQLELFGNRSSVSGTLIGVVRKLEQLISAAANNSLRTFFEKFFQLSTINTYLLEQKDYLGFEMLVNFYDFVKEEQQRRKIKNLGALLQLLTKMRLYEIPIPYVQVIGQGNGVHFSTVHGAKGLEYSEVFLMGCDKNAWLRSSAMGKIPYPMSVVKTTENSSEENLEENRRLFYVALTRAKSLLHISYSKTANGKEQSPVDYLTEIINEQVRVNDIPADTIPASELAGFVSDTMLTTRTDQEEILHQVIDRFLEDYRISVSHLNQYLRCPVEFYYATILKVPQPPSEVDEFHFNFGIAIHRALQVFVQRSRSADKKVIHEFLGKKDLLDIFTEAMQETRYKFEERRFEEGMAYGRKILEAYYDQRIVQWSKVITIERDFLAEWNGIRLKGRLDKLEFDGNDVVVVDYKTGNPEKAGEKIRRPKDISWVLNAPLDGRQGSDYWRQAVFYKMLIDNEQDRKYRFRYAEFDFIEPVKTDGRFEKIILDIHQGDEEMLKIQLDAVWKNIYARNFSKGCERPDCFWCNFDKNPK